ncbi:GcrA family cell cycle regulator [Sandaracinobacteroides saxicola]|uniref:Global cell cycle regulator GcrA-like protein n=1 Tax=Sandaracinobacteroides saxicola TaxID=2759707 RepID=A0A7G5IJJ8_9SPHN|nr:GcrA family cell cycle regulator [Sandaracinobacteroides saxicola]QMW23540.1 global cell cycle regulator GcrA-like protein [Sandaracinobacteroides saxicola]
MAWTDERIAQLKKLWEEGKSASQIAEILAEGISRNAIIGKAHRLGLASRPSPLKVAEAAPAPAPAAAVAAPAEPRPAPAVVAAPKPKPAKPAPKAARVTLLDLNDRICKWPIGHPDEADFHFCGKPVNPGFPYCGEHCLVAYQAQMPRKDRPMGQPGRPIGPNLPRPR